MTESLFAALMTRGVWILFRAQVVVPVRVLRVTCKCWTKTCELNQNSFSLLKQAFFALGLWQTNWGQKSCEGMHRTVHNSSFKALECYPGEKVLAEEEKDLLPDSHIAELVANATNPLSSRIKAPYLEEWINISRPWGYWESCVSWRSSSLLCQVKQQKMLAWVLRK